jgi:hypothetical protein
LKAGHSRYLIDHHLNLIGNYLPTSIPYFTLYHSLMNLFLQEVVQASIYSDGLVNYLQLWNFQKLLDYLSFSLFQLLEIVNLNLIMNYYLLFKVKPVLYPYYQNIIISLTNLILLLFLFIFLLELSMLIPYLFIVKHL